MPVSSSGHLVLTQKILGLSETGLTVEIILHLGSHLAVLIYFRHKIYLVASSFFVAENKKHKNLFLFLVVGTIPAVFVGLFLKSFIESAFDSPFFASAMLVITGIILLTTRFKRKDKKELTKSNAVLIGITQAIAILPGISRSGITISAGMHLGIKPEEAAEFSFLLAIPAIMGAVALNLGEFITLDSSQLSLYAVGLIVSLFSSLFAVYLVMKLIGQGKFEYFGYYCIAAGLTGLYLLG